jgi:hypothetical protein
MKKAIPKEWMDIIKTENSKKKVIIFRNYVLIKGKPSKFSILRNIFFMNCFSMRNLSNQLASIHEILIYRNYQNVKPYGILYLII